MRRRWHGKVRFFWMVGPEGVAWVLKAEGARAPSGQRHRNKRTIKRWILDDVYKPHTSGLLETV